MEKKIEVTKIKNYVLLFFEVSYESKWQLILKIVTSTHRIEP
jgi:hypothetical protein